MPNSQISIYLEDQSDEAINLEMLYGTAKEELDEVLDFMPVAVTSTFVSNHSTNQSSVAFMHTNEGWVNLYNSAFHDRFMTVIKTLCDVYVREYSDEAWILLEKGNTCRCIFDYSYNNYRKTTLQLYDNGQNITLIEREFGDDDSTGLYFTRHLPNGAEVYDPQDQPPL